MYNHSLLDWPAGVSVHKPEKCYNGYTLVHGRGKWDPVRGAAVDHEPYWHLIDMSGRVVQKWYGDPTRKAGSQLFEMLANGHFISNGANIVEQDWDGNVVQCVQGKRPGARQQFHHDVQTTAEGLYIGMSNELMSVPEICKVPLLDDHVMAFDRDGKMVWDWWCHEHYDQFDISDEGRRLIHEIDGHDDGFDWAHLNTIHSLPDNPLADAGDERFKPGNLLLNSRNLSFPFIVDWVTGDVVWQWSNKPPGASRACVVQSVDETAHCLVGPHDAKMLDNGNILIYDNGGHAGYPLIVRFYTRLVEVDPVTGRVVWEYYHRDKSSKWLSINTGGMQRLPNGNTLSLATNQGRVFEVTPQGEIVWEYANPRGGFYRTQRIAYEDCPEANPFYMETDGHLGTTPAKIEPLAGMGLPVAGTADYCPHSVLTNRS